MVGVGQVDLGHVKTGRIDGGPRSAIVVGAGIVGLSTAWFLQEHGIEVTVVDRIGVAAGASWGNAGWIAPSLVALDEPATLRHGLSSLLRPTGSLHDVAISDPGLWGFLGRVSANRRWSSWTRAVRDNLPLNDGSVEAFEMLTTNGVNVPTVEASIIAAFRSMWQAEGLLGVLDRLEEAGQPVAYTGLFGEALREHTPLASQALTVGVRIEGQRYVDPAAFTNALARSVTARGGVLRTHDVVDVRPYRGGVRVYARGGPVMGADVAVIATGAWLPHLAHRYGVRTSPQISRGYSFTVPVDRCLPGPIYLPEARVMCTPHQDGMRVVGMTESEDSHASGILKQVNSTIASVRPLLDGVRWNEHGSTWVGESPVTFDGRPLIGAAPEPGVYLAGGHGTWGFAHGPVTGRLLAEQIATGMQSDALRPFNPLRLLGRSRTGASHAAAAVTHHR